MQPSKPDSDLDEERRYLGELATRARKVLGERLVGVYAGGSVALGGYQKGGSDLDVAVVVDSELPPGLRTPLVERLRHKALPCPACKLELVVYRLRTTLSGTAARDFELNLNSGAHERLLVEDGPGDQPTFWYPIDRSIFAQAGVAILGPPAREVFAPIPAEQLRPLLQESSRWHQAHADNAGAAVNEARAQRFLREGRWSPKREGGLRLRP